jgi:predicted urease superfamily metal-dependent hydrolase
MNKVALSQADTCRLEKLAQAAGRTPRSVLKHVLCNGFEATEYAVRVVTSRMQTNQRISHKAAMQQLDQMMQTHGCSNETRRNYPSCNTGTNYD